MQDAPYPPDLVAHVTNEDRFAPIPEALLYDSSICAEAVRVYGVLRRHGDDPSNCYPSHARIAQIIGKSPRSVPGWIRQLEAGGYVERFARRTDNGDPDSNAYRVHMRAVERGVRAGERGPSAPHSVEGSAPPRAPKESQSEREQVNDNPSVVVVAFDGMDAFEHWWSIYPRHTAKGAARKAWAAAVKKAGDVELLFAGARRYSDDPARDPKYTKHPTTWLNGECWGDEPLPARTGNGRPAQRILGDEARGGESRVLTREEILAEMEG